MRLRFWTNDSSVLPITSAESKGSLLPRRYARLLGVAGVSTVILLFMLYFDKMPDSTSLARLRKPPLYQKYNEFERKLPQNDPTLPYPEGNHAKFIHFANHQYDAGWGNALQELFLNAHLAIVLKRSYVFDNYTWERGTNDYSNWNGNVIPARIPLSAYITGPLVGGAFGPGYEDVPRAVHADYFRQVCPQPHIVNTDSVRERVGWPTTTNAIIKAWVKEFEEKYKDERCIEIDINTGQIFHVFLFGMPYVLDVWPDLKYSPVITHFGWAPLVTNAYEKNRHIWESSAQPPSRWASLVSSAPSDLPTTVDTSPIANHTTRSPIPGLMALHIRRGDFENHCDHLWRWSAHYNGWNDFTEFPDQFTPPPGSSWGENTPENRLIYMEHCFPNIEQIVKKVMTVKKAHKQKGDLELRRIYVMTNAKKPWLAELAKALEDANPGGWDAIMSSRDLDLNREQKFVSQAVDMYVGGRAEVFIGNGFSSLTSNVAMLRMAYEVDPNDTRFW